MVFRLAITHGPGEHTPGRHVPRLAQELGEARASFALKDARVGTGTIVRLLSSRATHVLSFCMVGLLFACGSVPPGTTHAIIDRCAGLSIWSYIGVYGKLARVIYPQPSLEDGYGQDSEAESHPPDDVFLIVRRPS